MTLGLFAVLTLALLAVAAPCMRSAYLQTVVVDQRAEHRG